MSEYSDSIELQGGPANQPEEFRQVAGAANAAGLRGLELAEVDYGLDTDRPVVALRARVRLTYRRAKNPGLRRAARAAWELCQSLLAVRDGATDELIREVADALAAAVEKRGANHA